MENNEKKIGIFGIICLIFGILSFIFSVFVSLGVPLYLCIITAIISIVMGIVAFCVKDKVALPIIGISVSIVGLIIAIVITIMSMVVNGVKQGMDAINDYANNIISNDSYTFGSKDQISGYTWIEKDDDSLLELNKNGTFHYYKDKDDLTDYYYEGTYKVYTGKDAINYIANNLKSYGVTEEEQKDIIERNSQYSEENYYCLILTSTKCMIDGENTLTTSSVETPYFGFYLKNGTLNIANMKSGNYYNFVKE